MKKIIDISHKDISHVSGSWCNLNGTPCQCTCFCDADKFKINATNTNDNCFSVCKNAFSCTTESDSDKCPCSGYSHAIFYTGAMGILYGALRLTYKILKHPAPPIKIEPD